MTYRPILVISGPTCSGKSLLASELAAYYNGVVINADSMQVYQGINIIAAVPQNMRVPHRLYSIWHPEISGSVFLWLEHVKNVLNDCWRHEKLPIVCGGSGLYLSYLLNGYHMIPKARFSFFEDTHTLYRRLCAWDPEYAARIAHNDRFRIVRALSVLMHTGKSIAIWQKQKKTYLFDNLNAFVIAIIPSRSVLYQNIDARVDQMISLGAIEEVYALQQYFRIKKRSADSMPIMNALGVPQLLSYLKGISSLEESTALWKRNTRHYAKRQISWIRNQIKPHRIIKKASDFLPTIDFF